MEHFDSTDMSGEVRCPRKVIALPIDAWEGFAESLEADGREPTEPARKAAARYRKGKVVGDNYLSEHEQDQRSD